MRTPGRTYSQGDRIVCWFSCGVTSAVATKIAIEEYGHGNLRIMYCDTGSEHSSNERFLDDCQEWFGHPIEPLRSSKYRTIWEVFEGERYLTGVHGAPCTRALKTRLRQKFEDFDDIQVFGFDPSEKDRAEKIIANGNDEVKLWAPLIERNISKEACFEIVSRAKIELPFLYHPQKSGAPYNHNNCIGCVKGQMGYWNKIRIDFPEVFERMALLERKIGAAINKSYAGDGKRKRVFLDELDPDAGRFEKEPPMTCDLLCQIEAAEFKDAAE